MNDRKEQLAQLMEEHGAAVLRTAYLYVKDVSLAEDVYQEVFLKVFRNLDTFRGESSMKTWILRITMNLCKDYLKSTWFKRFFTGKQQEIESYTDWLKDENSPEKLLMEQEEKSELLQTVFGLSVPLREVLILHYFHDLSVEEIATLLQVAEGTVKSRLHRARLAIKARYSLDRKEEAE